MEFQWDPNKNAANQRKHGIGFREAATVFYDPLSTTFPDYLTIGMSARGRLIVVAHAEPDHSPYEQRFPGETIRIISARQVTRRERKFYEEGKSETK